MAFNNFLMRNRRDSHQDYTFEFQIEGFEEHVCFTERGRDSKAWWVFCLLTFFGFALPFVYIYERSIARYEVNLLKRVTV
jgi:hypothetical protein